MAGKEKGDPNLYKDGGEGKLQDEEWGSQSTTAKVQYDVYIFFGKFQTKAEMLHMLTSSIDL